MSKEKDGVMPSAVVGKDGLVVVPQLAPEHTLSGTREIAGGLVGMAEQAIAMQAGAFDMETAKANVMKLAEFTEFLKTVAFGKLRSTDFVSFAEISGNEEDEGQPWLSVGAAERVAETCGIACGFLEPAIEEDTGEDSNGPYFVKRAKMWFRVGSRYAEAIGEISSRDGLLSGGGKLSAAQVPRTRITQKAISRATQTGVGKILGLRSLTWERVRELMGDKAPKPEDVKKAKFKAGARGGDIQTGKDTDKATSGQFGTVYGGWCEAEGKSNAREAFKGNADAFASFVNSFLNQPPDTRMRKWTEYTKGEVRTLIQATKDIAAQGGSHE